MVRARWGWPSGLLRFCERDPGTPGHRAPQASPGGRNVAGGSAERRILHGEDAQRLQFGQPEPRPARGWRPCRVDECSRPSSDSSLISASSWAGVTWFESGASSPSARTGGAPLGGVWCRGASSRRRGVRRKHYNSLIPSRDAHRMQSAVVWHTTTSLLRRTNVDSPA
jgi:hypothetical protein